MKISKKIISLVLAVVLLDCASMVSFSAASRVTENGYTIEITEAGKGTLVTWTGDSGDLVVPSQIAGRYVIGIRQNAFYQRDDITSVNLSKANLLDFIGYNAFRECTSLTTIMLPYAVGEIGTSTFQGCTSLESVEIYSPLSYIPSQCFYKCSSLKSINIPSSVSEIQNLAFADCTALEKLYIPRTVTSIHSSAFRDDAALTIQCYSGSYAQEYAETNNISYELLDKPAPVYKLGDVDLSGNVSINDVTVIQYHIAEIKHMNETQLSVADVDGDGEVKIDDATKIQRILAELG